MADLGESIRISDVDVFEQVLRRSSELALLDTDGVFASPMPGFLADVTESLGPWRGREQRDFEIPSVHDEATALSPEERQVAAGFSMRRVKAYPGFEIGGKTYHVRPEDFLYGGMPAAVARRKVLRPRLDWNKKVAKELLDLFTQGAVTDGSNNPQEGHAWSAVDNKGNTITQDLATDTADTSAAVVAHSTQTIPWPLRDGTETAANHDHVATGAGAAYTLALGKTHSELVLEHPGAEGVRAIFGANPSADLRALIKSEYGAIESRVPFVKKSLQAQGGFAGAFPIVENLEGVDYFFSPEMPDDIAVYYASNQTPMYLALGQLGLNGLSVGTGDWTEKGNPETRGAAYGKRDYVTMGIQNPVGMAVVEYTA